MNLFFPYAKQSINDSDKEAVAAQLSAPLITRGPKVSEFEKAIADYTGATYAVAFTSGSTALLAAYSAAQIGPQDRVVTTPNTFIATLAPATELGATPVFIDIDRSSGNLNLDQLSQNLSFSSLKGRLFILPVHFSGIALDMRYLDSLIENSATFVIEDAAHALGSRYPSGEMVGSCAYSLMTIFSFHPAKQITTGEGGMVTTNDKEIYRKLLLFRNNGIERDPHYLQAHPEPWYYEVESVSSNYNFTEIQAALGLSQLKRLDKFVEKRRKLVSRYRENLGEVEAIKLFTSLNDAWTSFHLFVVQIDLKSLSLTRTRVMEDLKAKGIGSQYHYIPLYRLPCYAKGMKDLPDYFPEMEAYYGQALSLPLYYELEEKDVDYICTALKGILKK